jgi:membrane associated rhomboid family serine protease
MKTIQLSQPYMALDTCKSCTLVWLDTGQFEQLPEGVIDTPENALERALEAEGKWKIEEQERLRRGLSNDAPDEPWKWVLAMLGLPVKYDSPEISRRPWATWSLALLMIFISFWAFGDLRDNVQKFGLIPDEKWRYGGLTFLTSFFIHGGVFHLVGNLYFFLLFSGEVEEYLGRWRLLTLVLLSAFVGDWFHILGEPRAHEPSIGASGGISGVMVFYALQFPKARILFFIIRFGWLHLPAWGAFLIWFLIQLFGISMQRAGLTNVSALAHVGGVTTGIVLWFFWRKLKLNKPADAIEQ